VISHSDAQRRGRLAEMQPHGVKALARWLIERPGSRASGHRLADSRERLLEVREDVMSSGVV
jgi:hypothetical protein